jgi:hypothetical protein
LSPNVPDQLPGRLARIQAAQNQDAGPVNCIRLFGALLRMSPLRLSPGDELSSVDLPEPH